MATRILATSSPGEIRVAVTTNDRLIDYAIARPGRPDGVGDLHRGRVTAIVPAMAGAFVALATGEDGFLPDSQSPPGLTEGSAVLVRITRAAQVGKGPRLSGRDIPDTPAAGETGLSLLRRGPGPVERFAAAHPEAGIATDDPALLAALRPTLGERLTLDRAPWDDTLADVVDALSQPSVTLPGGAVLHVYPTPALVAIDVDAGARTAANRSKSAALRALNRSVIPGLAAQIRLRNLSGAILVDLAGLSPRDRAALGPAMAQALADDPLRPHLLGFTGLGLMEIVRPRIHPPLHEMQTGPHAAGLAALRAAVADSGAVAGEPIALRAHPAVIRMLEQDAFALPDFTRRSSRPLALRADPSLPQDQWVLEI